MASNKLIELLKENKDLLGLLKDEKTLETLMAMKQVFAERFLERGDLRFLILNSVASKPKHGYQIITSISKKFEGLYRPSPGAVYPTLQSLEEEGLIKSREEGGKKTYALTKRGKAYFKKKKKRVEEIYSNFTECHFLKDEKISKHFQRLGVLWAQIAHEVYFKAMMGWKSGVSDLDGRMKRTERVLERTLKEAKEIWG